MPVGITRLVRSCFFRRKRVKFKLEFELRVCCWRDLRKVSTAAVVKPQSVCKKVLSERVAHPECVKTIG